MSRLFTSMREPLSMIAAARLALVGRCEGTTPTRVAARMSGAAISITIAIAPIHLRDFIRPALLSLGPISEGQLGAQPHHARNPMEEGRALGELVALGGSIRTVFPGVPLDERLPFRRLEPIGRQG